ncbi:MAG TPA: DedA family protein [Streptosporangiaceae bacterium]|nr:DedA family protein [Streptosporangiaceae bacterium]
MSHSVAAAAPVALNLLDPHSLLASAGALGVFLVLFAETGLLIGFFLPGDSLLFTAGLLSATSAGSAAHLSLPAVLVAAVAGALAGAQVGFLIGRRAGHALMARPPQSRLRQGIESAQRAIDRYGAPRAIVLARFIPVVRTVVNPLAGAIGVPLRTFTTWQVAGGLVWSVGVTLAGYELGSRISNIDHYLLPVIAIIVAVSLIPVALELWRHRRARRGARDPGKAPDPGKNV